VFKIKATPFGIRVKKLYPDAELPKKANPNATGFDLFAYLPESKSITLNSHPQLVGTGIAMEIPRGYDVQIRPRSGLSSKGVGLSLGTIDNDYRGEIKVVLYLFILGETLLLLHGERIAQMVITKTTNLRIVEVDELTPTERGDKGFGSTGK